MNNKDNTSDELLYQIVLSHKLQRVLSPIHPRSLIKLKPENQKDQEAALFYQETLDGLVQILGEGDWALSGGLAIPATMQDFSNDRIHRALHIGIPSTELPEIVEKARLDSHYFLYRRIASIHHSPTQKSDFYSPIHPKELENPIQMIDDQIKNLRLIYMEANNLGRIKPHDSNHLLSYLDIFLHDKIGNVTISNDDKNRLFEGDYYAGEVYTTLSGKKIKIANLEYIKQRKKEGKDEKGREKNEFDIEKIKKRQEKNRFHNSIK